MKKVYFAGKISANCWRHDICRMQERGPDDYLSGLDPAVRPSSLRGAIRSFHLNGEIVYNGPFLGGRNHGYPHSRGSHSRKPDCFQKGPRKYANPSRVVSDCLDQVIDSDAVFAWADQDFSSAYGTIAVISYAAARNIPVYLADLECEENLSNLMGAWFPLRLCNRLGTFDSVESAWANAQEVIIKQGKNGAVGPTPKQWAYIESLLSEKGAPGVKDDWRYNRSLAGALIGCLVNKKPVPKELVP